MVLVTDIKRVLWKGDKKKEKTVTGFYMQPYLARNLNTIPLFLKKSWDCIGIVSGHGKVRIGKSTMAAQVCFYIAWLLAGGYHEFDEGSKIIKTKLPDKPVRFNLQENVVFSAEELQSRAVSLYEKYGPHQVLMYDEGRQGLDSARTMESINKGMEDFLQECGFMGHVIIIVLPSFFKLHEDYAVSRSLFLIDVFADKNFNRGYFNFYNERQKEYLFHFGKKRVGTTAKYQASYESFWGKFTSWLPFDKTIYEEIKKVAIKKKRMNRMAKNLLLQRNTLLWVLRKKFDVSCKKLHELLLEIGGVNLKAQTIKLNIAMISDLQLQKKGF